MKRVDELYLLIGNYEDPTIDWGTSGDCSVLGLFSSEEKALQAVKKIRGIKPDSEISRVELLYDHDACITYGVIPLKPDKQIERTIANWWYEE